MSIEVKQSKSTAFYIVVSLVCLIGIGFFLFVSFDGSAGSKSAQVGEMQEMTRQVRNMETQVEKEEGEVAGLVNRYREKTGAETPLNFDMTDLSPKERELLEQQIGKEKDVSIKSLLREILEKNGSIADLKDEIAAIESKLPRPHIAQKGESHYQIAMAYLVEEQGLEKEQAQEIVSRTALFDELAAGFKVWNFYSGGEYGTAVTQGDAQVSPNVFVHRAKRKLAAERDEAVSQRDKLAEEYKHIADRQEEVVTQLDEVSREKKSLENRVVQLDRQVNSVFYRLDLQENLKKKKILKSGFLTSTKLRDVSPEQFDQSLDLSIDNQLVISAASLKIKKIQDVVLYPKFYKKGASYKVFITPNKKHALLTLLDSARFKSERVVIAVK